MVQKKREILERLPASKGLKSLFAREKMKIKKLEKTKVLRTCRRCTTRLLRCWGTHTPLTPVTANARLDQAHAGPACALEALGCSNYAALMHWDYAVPYSDWLGHLILYRGLAWACCLRYRWRDELNTFRHAKSAYFKTDRKGYQVRIVQDLWQWASKD